MQSIGSIGRTAAALKSYLIQSEVARAPVRMRIDWTNTLKRRSSVAMAESDRSKVSLPFRMPALLR
jgi:hypothetical protein